MWSRTKTFAIVSAGGGSPATAPLVEGGACTQTHVVPGQSAEKSQPTALMYRSEGVTDEAEGDPFAVRYVGVQLTFAARYTSTLCAAKTGLEKMAAELFSGTPTADIFFALQTRQTR